VPPTGPIDAAGLFSPIFEYAASKMVAFKLGPP